MLTVLGDLPPPPVELLKWAECLVWMMGAVILAIAFKRQVAPDKSAKAREISPQPLQVVGTTEMAREKDCREREERLKKDIDALWTRRNDDEAVWAKNRKSLYDHIDQVERELGKKIDSMPAQIVTQLLNTKQLWGEGRKTGI